MRVAGVILGLPACAFLACGKIQGPGDAEAARSDEVATLEEGPPGEVATSSVTAAKPAAATPVAPGAGAACSAAPPPLVLESEGGEQAGAVGSFCITNTGLGCALCADGIVPRNESFTVAHPGDELTIAMPGARLTASPRCTPACSLEATIMPATCFEGRLSPPLFAVADDAVQRTIIAEGEPWALTVAPGLYFVQVGGGELVAADGWSGEASGTLGLLVDPARERGIVDGAPFYADCQASSSSDAGSDAGAAEPDGGVTSDERGPSAR